MKERVLALGLNFAVAPKRVPYREIIASTEETARQLDADGDKQLRICVSKALHKAQTPRSNLDKGMCKAIKDLKRTVVKDCSEYTMKMNTPTQEGPNSQG